MKLTLTASSTCNTEARWLAFDNARLDFAPVPEPSTLAVLVGGLLAGVIATGLLPLAEMTFRYTTDIKLLELANLDQALLREQMVQAPGTYHHSVIVSNMVEASAKAVGANPILSRVAAYYHDIGKVKKPLYFIENQIHCENKHEKLAPSMSSLILISHVKDGVEMAKLMKWMGHASVEMVMRYYTLGEDESRQAMLSVPFEGIAERSAN